MAIIAAETIARAGLNATYNAAAAAGDKCLLSARTLLHFKNASGAATRTVTFDSKVNCNQGTDHNPTCVVAISGDRFCGPFEMARFRDADGYLNWTYSDHADVTVAVMTLPESE